MRNTPTEARDRIRSPISTKGKRSYREQLPEADRQVYDNASDQPDMREEIQLVRALIAMLARDPQLNHAEIAKAVATLCRVIALHIRAQGSSSDLADLIAEASEEVLERHRAVLPPDGEEAASGLV